MTYGITITGLEQLIAKLTPALWERALVNLLTDASLMAEREARTGINNDTSALARSVTSEVKSPMARVYTTLDYARPVEEGRAPGSRMPPPDALTGWMGRHGVDPKLAYVLARAIARRGIKGRWYMRHAREKVQAAMPDLVRKAAEDIRAAWGA